MTRPTERYGAAILKSTMDAVIIFPRDGSILEFNPAAQRMFGFTEEHFGQPLKEYLVDPPPERARDMVKIGELFEMTAQSTEGLRFPVDLLVVLIPETEPALFAAFIRSIDKRKEIERQLARAKEAAEAANVAKSSFLSSLSHEVRTPLSVISGMAELLHETGLSTEQAQILEEIRGSAEILLRRIDELLDLSKLESGQIDFLPRPFVLGDLVDGACRLVRRQAADKKLDLTVSTGDGDKILIGDADRLQEILVNLLSNAVKFSDHGNVRLGAAVEDAPDNLLRLSVTVADSGIGIAPEHQERIFERFFRVPGTARRGSGLGLGIASGLAYMMGGRLWLEESAPGRGSTFRFEVTLPRADPSQVPQISSAPVLTEPAHLLLAEDHEPTRRILVRFLESGGHYVDVVTDGLQAEARVLEREYDVILLDVEMPGLDGIEVARRIRGIESGQGRRHTSIVALTAHTFRDFRERYLAAGINHYFIKPVLRDTLLRKISTILADRSPEGPPPQGSSEAPILVRIDSDIADLVDDFLAGRRGEVEEMAAQIARGELERTAILAHNLKGSAGAYGFHHLTALGSALQRAASEGDANLSLAVLEEISAYLRRVRPVT